MIFVFLIIGGVLVLLLLLILLVGLTLRDKKVLLSGYKYINHNGLKRAHLIYRPPTKNVKRIILSFHGFTDNARRHAYYTALHNTTDKHTLVIYPQASTPTKKGILNGWNAGFCCGSGWVQKVDDVDYVKTLINKFCAEYKVDASNTYISGFSNGAMLVHKIAAGYPELIAGAACIAGAIGANDCQLKPKTSVAMLLIHGKKDINVPFAGGQGKTTGFDWRSFEQSVNTWHSLNGGEPLKSSDEFKITTLYKGASKLFKTMVYHNGKHAWPGWRLWQLSRRRPEASREVVSFFESI